MLVAGYRGALKVSEGRNHRQRGPVTRLVPSQCLQRFALGSGILRWPRDLTDIPSLLYALRAQTRTSAHLHMHSPFSLHLYSRRAELLF